jgi:hypothetical protein
VASAVQEAVVESFRYPVINLPSSTKPERVGDQA